MSDMAVLNKAKEKTKELIEAGEIELAKELVEKYRYVLKEDVEVYSIRAVIAMIEGKLNEAEIILKEGLEKSPYNEDMLFNMIYLLNTMERGESALELFCKLKFFNKNSNIKLMDIGLEQRKLNKDHLRVIHGTIEIANQMNIITKGLKTIGVDAKSINYYPTYLRYKSNYIVDINSFKDINEADTKTKELAAKIISNNDIFHFHFGTSLNLDYSDLEILKELDKKVVMQHWGSDVRIYSEAVKYSPNVKVKQSNEEKIKRQLDFLSRNISSCIVSDYELYNYVKDYYKNVNVIPPCIDLKEFQLKDSKNEKLTIVHAPTNREIKGTDYIIKAVEDLKLSYDFEFILIENMSHQQATETYRKADVVIDQLLIGSYGLVSIENMALGKPVICYINEKMRTYYPKDLPIISADVKNIKNKIEYLIKNQDYLKQLGLKGRKYVEQYHDINILKYKILEIYKAI